MFAICFNKHIDIHYANSLCIYAQRALDSRQLVASKIKKENESLDFDTRSLIETVIRIANESLVRLFENYAKLGAEYVRNIRALLVSSVIGNSLIREQALVGAKNS